MHTYIGLEEVPSSLRNTGFEIRNNPKQECMQSAYMGFGVGRGSHRNCLVRAKVFPGSFLGKGRNWRGWTTQGASKGVSELTGVKAGMCLMGRLGV